MSLRTARIVRIATLAGLAAVVLLAVRRLDAPSPTESVEPRRGERSVRDAIQHGGAVESVRGYVFEGPGGLALRICEGRTRGRPPACLGPFIELDNADAGTFNLRKGTVDGKTVRWAPDPLTLVGPVDGVRLNVQQVLR